MPVTFYLSSGADGWFVEAIEAGDPPKRYSAGAVWTGRAAPKTLAAGLALLRLRHERQPSFPPTIDARRGGGELELARTLRGFDKGYTRKKDGSHWTQRVFGPKETPAKTKPLAGLIATQSDTRPMVSYADGAGPEVCAFIFDGNAPTTESLERFVQAGGKLTIGEIYPASGLTAHSDDCAEVSLPPLPRPPSAKAGHQAVIEYYRDRHGHVMLHQYPLMLAGKIPEGHWWTTFFNTLVDQFADALRERLSVDQLYEWMKFRDSQAALEENGRPNGLNEKQAWHTIGRRCGGTEFVDFMNLVYDGKVGTAFKRYFPDFNAGRLGEPPLAGEGQNAVRQKKVRRRSGRR